MGFFVLVFFFLFLRHLQNPATARSVSTVTVNNSTVLAFYHTQRCEELELPDAPLRAFRRSDGAVVAFATHYLNRHLIGPAPAKLSLDCHIVYQGAHLEDPGKFDDRTWITAT